MNATSKATIDDLRSDAKPLAEYLDISLVKKADALPKLESKAKMISYKKTQQQIRSITTSSSSSPRRSVNQIAKTIEDEYGLRKSNVDLRISQISKITESYDRHPSEF